MGKLFKKKAPAPKKKEQEQAVVYHCEDCAHAVPDTRFENLSLNGEPTLLICPFERWKKLFKEPACRANFKLRGGDDSVEDDMPEGGQYSLF